MEILHRSRQRSRSPRAFIAEPDVALTDFVLAVESGILAVRLARQRPLPPARTVRRWLVAFFASTGAAALLGGVDHGFLRDLPGRGHAIVWPGSLIAIGVSSLAIWAIAAELQCRPKVARGLQGAGLVVLAGYSGLVLLVDGRFIYAVGLYLPAATALLLVLGLAYTRHREPALLFGLGSIVLTFVAAGAQARGIGLHPRYFNHNAVHHAIQAVALLLFWSCAERIVAVPALSAAADPPHPRAFIRSS